MRAFACDCERRKSITRTRTNKHSREHTSVCVARPVAVGLAHTQNKSCVQFVAIVSRAHTVCDSPGWILNELVSDNDDVARCQVQK